MQSKIILSFALLFCINFYSQISFEKGFLITNNGVKVNCLIKNMDWKTTPIEFEYKLSEEDETKIGTVNTIKEFEIENKLKYISAKVNLDKSSEKINEMNFNRDPEFVNVQLFLKVLIEGESTLYHYENEEFTRFFYKKEDKIEQLINKKYLSPDQVVKQYSLYKQQLWNHLKCPSITMTEIEKVTYDRKSLVNFFIEYNNCHNSTVVNYTIKEKKDLFNLTLRPRLNYSNLTVSNSSAVYLNMGFDKKMNFGFGVEAEFIFPYNKNKWSFIVEPAYQNFKSEGFSSSNSISGGVANGTIDYKSIELALGFRHYFFLKDNSKLFLDVSFVLDFESKSVITFTRNDGSVIDTFDIGSRNNFAIGFGYKIKDKYSLQIRQQTSREILGDYPTWKTNFSTTSLVFGYSFF